MNRSLLALALGAFGIGISKFVMMGILPDVARGIDVSISQSGHLISAYALGAVAGAPIFLLFRNKISQKSALVGLMIWFTLFNTVSAFASDYLSMLVARFMSGIPHCAFFGIGTVAASKLGARGKSGRSIALMFAGLTVANVFGVPLGTFVSSQIDWRLPFVLVSLIGLLAIWCIRKWIPEIPHQPENHIKTDLKLFNQPASWLVLLTTIIGTAGFFAWYSYITPLLTEVTGFRSEQMPFILMLAGLGMTAGSILGGRLIDRYSTLNTTMYFLVCMSLSLSILSLVAGNKIMVLTMTFLVSTFAFCLFGSLQMIMIKVSRGSEILGSTINQGAFNIANALGTFMGGWPLIFGFGHLMTQWIGATMAFSGAAIAGYMILRRQRSKMPYYYFGSI